MKALKTGEHEFNVLQVVTGCDYPEENKIEVNYILASFIKNTELILKVRLPRGDEKGRLRLILFVLFGARRTF